MYTILGIVPIYSLGDVDGMYSAVILKGRDALMVSFPSGDVHHADKIREHARAFTAAFFGSGAAAMEGRLVLAGHSEGAVLAEAVVLEMASSSDGAMQALMREALLIGSGAHLWMSPEDAEKVERALRGRVASFVVSKEGCYDGYAVHLKEVLAGEEEYDEVASLPRILVMHSTGGTQSIGRLSVSTSSVREGEHVLTADREVHHWQTYWQALDRMLAAYGLVGGRGPSDWTVVWASV